MNTVLVIVGVIWAGLILGCLGVAYLELRDRESL